MALLQYIYDQPTIGRQTEMDQVRVDVLGSFDLRPGHRTEIHEDDDFVGGT